MNGFEPVKGKVEIVEYDLINLVEHREFLRSLELAGVDNWKNYNVAVDFFEREKLKENKKFDVNRECAEGEAIGTGKSV